MGGAGHLLCGMYGARIRPDFLSVGLLSSRPRIRFCFGAFTYLTKSLQNNCTTTTVVELTADVLTITIFNCMVVFCVPRSTPSGETM